MQIYVKKANVVKSIDDKDIREWEKKGYKKIDEVPKKKGKTKDEDGKEKGIF